MAASPEEPKPVLSKPAAPTSATEAVPAPSGKPSKASFWRRLSIGTNVILQMLLLMFILLGVNGYAYKHYHRFDYSLDRKYALSDRTKQMLQSLTKPLKLIVFMTGQSLLQADVANLVEEYRITNPKMVSIENIDPFRNAGRAAEVQSKYKLNQQENVVVLDYEGRSKIVADNKMAEIDTSGMQYGQPATITAFTGEQAVTAALLEITEDKKINVCYLQGHGESVFGEGKPLQRLGKVLGDEHVSIQEINLLNARTVPADTGVLMILGARLDFTDREIQVLEDYWNKGGRLLLVLNPDAKTPHLTEFLDTLGIRVDDDRVLRTVDMGVQIGILRDVYTTFVGDTAIARRLAGVNVPLLGGTSTLTLAPGKVVTMGVQLAPLLQAMPGYWGETDYKDMETTGVYLDKGRDKENDLVVAATVQKGTVADQRVQANSARLVVVSNSHFVENEGISDQSAAFFVGSLNWLLERENLIGIPPKAIQNYTLNLPQEQLSRVFWLLVIAIPGFVAVLGLAVWWRRRS